MCKTEKKMDKINFNKFIWVIGKKMYIYIYFREVFPIVGMKINE